MLRHYWMYFVTRLALICKNYLHLQGHQGRGEGGWPKSEPSTAWIFTEACSLYHCYNRHRCPAWVLLLPEEDGEQPCSLIQSWVHCIRPPPVISDRSDVFQPIEVWDYLESAVLSYALFFETHDCGVGISWVLSVVAWSHKSMKHYVISLYSILILSLLIMLSFDAQHERAAIPLSICCIFLLSTCSAQWNATSYNLSWEFETWMLMISGKFR